MLNLFFATLAMPLLSGPGSISLLIGLFAEQTQWADRGVIVGVIAAMALIVYLIFASAPFVFRRLGESGLAAMSRIMGFLVMSIGIQYIIYGILSLAEIIQKGQ